MLDQNIRRHQRVLVPGAVEIRVAARGEGAGVEGVATVIGLGGMFLRTKTPQPPGSVLQLTLACLAVSIESECSVRHVSENGMGIEFAAMTPENEEKLRTLLLQLRV